MMESEKGSHGSKRSTAIAELISGHQHFAGLGHGGDHHLALEHFELARYQHIEMACGAALGDDKRAGRPLPLSPAGAIIQEPRAPTPPPVAGRARARSASSALAQICGKPRTRDKMLCGYRSDCQSLRP